MHFAMSRAGNCFTLLQLLTRTFTPRPPARMQDSRSLSHTHQWGGGFLFVRPPVLIEVAAEREREEREREQERERERERDLRHSHT